MSETQQPDPAPSLPHPDMATFGGDIIPPKRGRPFKLECDEATLDDISRLASIHCTTAEAAAWFRVHRDTFEDFLKRHPAANQAWEDGFLQGKVSLRRNQFRLAQTKPAMAIFLGKNILGQKDQIDLGHSGEINAKTTHVLSAEELKELPIDELARLYREETGAA